MPVPVPYRVCHQYTYRALLGQIVPLQGPTWTRVTLTGSYVDQSYTYRVLLGPGLHLPGPTWTNTSEVSQLGIVFSMSSAVVVSSVVKSEYEIMTQ